MTGSARPSLGGATIGGCNRLREKSGFNVYLDAFSQRMGSPFRGDLLRCTRENGAATSVLFSDASRPGPEKPLTSSTQFFVAAAFSARVLLRVPHS